MPAIAIKEQITRHYADLSPQLQRAARFVSENPEDVATRTLRQIAGKSGLTPPTYSRLARAIGFEGYEGLRDSCRNEIRQKHLSLAERAKLLQEDAPNLRGSFASTHAISAVSNIQSLLDVMDTNHLADAADRLAKAKNVFLIGSLSSRMMAEYFSYVAQMAADNWKIVGEGASSVPATLTGINKDDVVLAIAISPYASSTVRAVQYADTANANIIAISDDLHSPILKHAKFSFLIPTESAQFFPSHVAMITFLEILVGMFVRRLGDSGQKRISAVEQSNHAIGDYWQQ